MARVRCSPSSTEPLAFVALSKWNPAYRSSFTAGIAASSVRTDSNLESRSARAYFSLKISRLRVESLLVAGGPAQHGTPPGFYISARGIPAGLQVDVAP